MHKWTRTQNMHNTVKKGTHEEMVFDRRTHPAVPSLSSLPRKFIFQSAHISHHLGTTRLRSCWWMQLRCLAELRSVFYFAMARPVQTHIQRRLSFAPLLWPFHLLHLPYSNFGLSKTLIMYSFLFTFGQSLLALWHYCPLVYWFFAHYCGNITSKWGNYRWPN